METFGGWHDKAVDQINRLARALSRSTGKEESRRHLYQRLGVLLTKANEAMWLNRVPSFPSSEVDGHE